MIIRVTCGPKATRHPWRTPGRPAGLGQPAELRWRLEREQDPRCEKPAGRYTKEPMPAGMGGQKGCTGMGKVSCGNTSLKGTAVTLETERSEPEALAGGGGGRPGGGVWPR